MLRRNMLTADCQNSEVKGKILGLHSTVFSERGDRNARLNPGNYGKNTENPLQLVKLGYLLWDPAAQEEVVQVLAGLQAPHGVFGCLGNHETINQTEESITRLFA